MGMNSAVSKQTFRAITLAGAILAVLTLASGANAGEAGMQRHVTVSAQGKVSARPDMANLSSGVVSEAATAGEALASNNVAMKNLVSSLKDWGIASGDIQTSGFNVSPRYTHNRDGKPPSIEGYSVTNDVHVVVRDLTRLGDLLDQLVRLGANRIGSLSFDVSSAETLKDDARKLAIANARQRAELYAAAAGARVGQVLSISEDSTHVAPRGPMMARAAMSEGVPVAEGSQDIEARVTVTWELQ
ncbi:MAG: SIMPL domain-containing protein [Hyphomicrobiaceae bacterium]|nr:SIMPL domain-containing protein [Hyphomicrobiaceae bacterium]